MAGVFTVVFLAFGFGTWVAVRRWLARGRLVNRYLPLVLALGVVGAYLVAKVAYEEIYPCVAVDSTYCDFDSTQYHNLFGWEF